MRTLLSQFCEEFDGAVRPLLEPLHRAAQALEGATTGAAIRAVLPQMRDVEHQLNTLAAKVAGQQAYVLIFGPLKSGKSTLMNAMCAAYVSEVTSLPAYPCLVNVSHSERREFSVTRYNGHSETFHDLAAMRMELQRAHSELAARVREVETRNEVFDPGIHYPQAIRRVEVKVPAGNLAESGAVLVDTPGLYVRMKFGYDRMTREFRNTAACAIFVVKTENLFLEQVFHEFNELLELFSRIFLVVNLDSSKKDLRPDGGLAPSLEHDDPIRIIQAFENLAMSAPLKAALEQGRLRIYPVDLLRAASRRLKSAQGGGAAAGAAALEPAEGSAESRGPGEADFDQFLTDLTDYLNSTDYLVAFLGDSLRHANGLMAELGALFEAPEISELHGEVQRLEQEKAAAHNKLQILERLAAFDWAQAFAPLHEQLKQGCQEQAAAIRDKTSQALAGALDQWFHSDSSLKDYGRDGADPLLASCQNELALTLHQALSGQVNAGQGAPGLPAGMRSNLAAASIDLGAVSRTALGRLDPYAGIQSASLQLSGSGVPVRKSFWDWLLFRGQAAVARRLFGPPSDPRQRVPRAVKAKRLGEPARKVLQSQVQGQFQAFYPAAQQRLVSEVYRGYAEPAQDSVRAAVAAKREECRAQLDAAQRRLEETRVLRELLEELRKAKAAAAQALAGLSERYGAADPWKLKQPIEPGEEIAVLEQ